jgi:hypothetical protein
MRVKQATTERPSVWRRGSTVPPAPSRQFGGILQEINKWRAVRRRSEGGSRAQNHAITGNLTWRFATH